MGKKTKLGQIKRPMNSLCYVDGKGTVWATPMKRRGKKRGK